MQSDDWGWIDEVDGDWTPPPIDLTKPSIARIYDYGLGGKDNYPIDRAVAEKFMAFAPDVPLAARANRGFLTEAVQSMLASGVRQFVDLGTGIPTSPNVHETAWAVAPDALVVYVDNDPIVLAHNRAMMQGEPRAAVLAHDLRDPAAVLGDRRVEALLDLSRPVGLLMVGVMHFVDIAAGPPVVARYLRDLAPGSQLAISSLSSHGIDPVVLRQTEAAYGRDTDAGVVYRTEAQLEALFDRLTMVRPLAEVYRSDTLVVLGGIGVKD